MTSEPIAPISAPKAIIVDGHLIPDAGTVRSMLFTLSQRLKSDPALEEKFKADPKGVLGEIGLSGDVQVEAAEYLGIEPSQIAGCAFTCARTCAITKLS